MIPPFPAILISKKRRQILNTFREAGATSPENAKTVEDIGLSKSILLEIQKLEGVLVEVEQNRFYLDKIREKQVIRFRRTLAVGLTAIVVLIALYLSR
jgi:hypothetical protein